MLNKILNLFFLLSLLFCISACQSVKNIRPIEGISFSDVLSGKNTQFYQIEMKRFSQEVSFLWFEEFHANRILITATTLTGASLFQLQYANKKVEVLDVINELKYIPFEYLLRDISWATQPIDVIKREFNQTEFRVEEPYANERYFYEKDVLLSTVKKIKKMNWSCIIKKYGMFYI